MKTQLFFLTLLLCININAQINFQEHIVIDESISANNPKSIVSIDIDGDGDKDIVSASYDDYTEGWYENLDGNGNFGVRKKYLFLIPVKEYHQYMLQILIMMVM